MGSHSDAVILLGALGVGLGGGPFFSPQGTRQDKWSTELGIEGEIG